MRIAHLKRINHKLFKENIEYIIFLYDKANGTEAPFNN